MAQAEALAAARARLKHSKIENDSSSVKTQETFETQESQREFYQNRVLDANLETYYEVLGPEITFPTIFVPLLKADAEFFIQHFESREKYRVHLVTQGITDADLDRHAEKWLTPALSAHIRSLETRLQPAISSLTSKERPGCFIKLSSRSPKDAVIQQREKITAAFRTALSRQDQPETDNARIIALLSAGAQLLCCETATDAVKLLTTSERVYQDCLLALDQPTRFVMNMCVRAWIPINPRDEFRCFCAPGSGRMTAISQYNYLAFWPELVAHAETNTKALISFYHETILPRLQAAGFGPAGYVCDLAFEQDSGRVWCLELNPFLATTDGALFSWERERSILEGSEPAPTAVAGETGATEAGPREGHRAGAGGAGPVLRVTTKPLAGAKALIASSWRWLLELPL